MELPPAGFSVPILDTFIDYSTYSLNFGQVGEQVAVEVVQVDGHMVQKVVVEDM